MGAVLSIMVPLLIAIVIMFVLRSIWVTRDQVSDTIEVLGAEMETRKKDQAENAHVVALFEKMADDTSRQGIFQPSNTSYAQNPGAPGPQNMMPPQGAAPVPGMPAGGSFQGLYGMPQQGHAQGGAVPPQYAQGGQMPPQGYVQGGQMPHPGGQAPVQGVPGAQDGGGYYPPNWPAGKPNK